MKPDRLRRPPAPAHFLPQHENRERGHHDRRGEQDGVDLGQGQHGEALPGKQPADGGESAAQRHQGPALRQQRPPAAAPLRQAEHRQQGEQRHRERDLEDGKALARQLDDRVGGGEAGIAQDGEADAPRGHAVAGDRRLQGGHRKAHGQGPLAARQHPRYIASQHRRLCLFRTAAMQEYHSASSAWRAGRQSRGQRRLSPPEEMPSGSPSRAAACRAVAVPSIADLTRFSPQFHPALTRLSGGGGAVGLSCARRNEPPRTGGKRMAPDNLFAPTTILPAAAALFELAATFRYLRAVAPRRDPTQPDDLADLDAPRLAHRRRQRRGRGRRHPGQARRQRAGRDRDRGTRACSAAPAAEPARTSPASPSPASGSGSGRAGRSRGRPRHVHGRRHCRRGPDPARHLA